MLTRVAHATHKTTQHHTHYTTPQTVLLFAHPCSNTFFPRDNRCHHTLHTKEKARKTHLRIISTRSVPNARTSPEPAAATSLFSTAPSPLLTPTPCALSAMVAAAAAAPRPPPPPETRLHARPPQLPLLTDDCCCCCCGGAGATAQGGGGADADCTTMMSSTPPTNK